jgi:hypothetical protein
MGGQVASEATTTLVTFLAQEDRPAEPTRTTAARRRKAVAVDQDFFIGISLWSILTIEAYYSMKDKVKLSPCQ